MKVEKEKIINDNGSYTIKEVWTQDSSDGFVPESEMYPASMDKRGKYFKGKAVVVSFATNDPRVTRPFAYGVCGFFLVIGIFLLLVPSILHKIMAVFFIVIPVIGFKTAKRDIDAIEEELKKKQAEREAQDLIGVGETEYIEMHDNVGEFIMNNRKITFEKIQNARDLGGLKNKNGRTIRTGLLLRSANLAETTETDKRKLAEEYHLAKVIDLRTEMERNQKPDVVPETAEYVANPIFDERVFGISHEKTEQKNPDEIEIPALEDLYRMMLGEEMCLENFGKAVRLVMEHDFTTGSVLWHCTEGKDRCGLLAVFLLSALGVEREVILEDYLLTNETNVPKAEMIGKQLEALGKPEARIEAIKNTFLAKESYLNAAYEVIEKQYGDMEAFLREGLGISGEMIMRFREKVLV